MNSPGTPPTSEADEIFWAVGQVEKVLDTFQKKIAPALQRVSAELGRVAFNIGQGYQQSARELYARVQERAEAQGEYSYTDLDDLSQVEEMVRTGRRIQAAGDIFNVVTKVGAWAYQAFQEKRSKEEIRRILSEEKARVPMLLANIDQAELRLKKILANQDLIFADRARQKASTWQQRRRIRRELDQCVDEYRKLAEAQARLAYCRHVYAIVGAFDFQSFQPSLERLLKAGTEDRATYQLHGLTYLEMLDDGIARLDWPAPYYAGKLPEGILYFLGPGKRRLPEGVRLKTIDDTIDRLRKETLASLRPADLSRAAGYSAYPIGSFEVTFGNAARIAKRVVITVGVLLALLLFFLSGLAARVGEWLGLSQVAWLQTPGQVAAALFLVLLVLGLGAWTAWMLRRDSGSGE